MMEVGAMGGSRRLCRVAMMGVVALALVAGPVLPERKAKAEKQESSDDGALKPMQIMIRDKIFCFEKCKGPDL